MPRRTRRLPVVVLLACTCSLAPWLALAQKEEGAAKGKPGHASSKDHPLAPADVKNPVLWEDPGNIAGKDLFYGRGGADHQPKPPFTFVEEDRNGTNPKFDARDSENKKWRVKLGVEARPEVTASRLLWAVGYFTDDDYVLPTATVAHLHLQRGRDLVQGETVTEARFDRKPKGEDKIADWRWKQNPFTGKREFNGLRVMMAVLNNWDLKDVNNAVYSDDKHDRQIFLVHDIGATFGSNTEHRTHDSDKGNLQSYETSKFVVKNEGGKVTFGTPAFPGKFLYDEGPVLVGEAFRRSALDWIGHDIPVADARWVGSLLGQLTHGQIEDAFRAGDFPTDQREAFVKVVEDRIAALKTL